MRNNKFVKIFLLGLLIVVLISFKVQAEVSSENVFKNLFGDKVTSLVQSWIPAGTVYENNDGSKAQLSYVLNFGRLQYRIDKSVNNESVEGVGWRYFCITINGQFPSWAAANSYNLLDFNENGKLKARYTYGNLVETYQYAKDGQMLVYNAQGELTGAYDNFYDRHLSEFNIYDKKAELNHVDENGNYTAKDGDKILGIYKADGGVMEYKYDKGGNLISIYDNGIATYQRKIYTPAEATAAVSGKNTFKIQYR